MRIHRLKLRHKLKLDLLGEVSYILFNKYNPQESMMKKLQLQDLIPDDLLRPADAAEVDAMMKRLQPRQPMPDDLLRTPEVACWIGRSAAWLDQRRSGISGPPFLKIGRNIFYRRSDVQKWIADEIAKSGGMQRTK